MASLVSMSDVTLRMADWSLDVDFCKLVMAISCSDGSWRSSRRALTSSSSSLLFSMSSVNAVAVADADADADADAVGVGAGVGVGVAAGGGCGESRGISSVISSKEELGLIVIVC